VPDAGPFEFAFDLASPKGRWAPPPMFGEPGGPPTGQKLTVILNTGSFFGAGSTSANGVTQPAGGWDATTDVVIQYPTSGPRTSFSNTQVANCRSLRIIGGKHLINATSTATPLRLFARESIYMEGFEIDGQGANADCWNGGGGTQPDLYFVNCWFHNVQGTQATVHADAIQPQTATGVIHMDRCSMESGYQVLYLPPLDGPIAGMIASRCDLRFRAGGPANSVAFWPTHDDQLLRSAANPTAVWNPSQVYPVELTEFYVQPHAGGTLVTCLFPGPSTGWADGSQTQTSTINNVVCGSVDAGFGDGSRTWPASVKVTGRVRSGVPAPGPVASGGFWKAGNVGIGYVSPGYQTTATPVTTVYNDGRSGGPTVSGTKTSAYWHTGARTGTVTASGTKSESKRYTDTRAGTVTVSGAKTESFQRVYTDSRSGTVALSGTKSESWSRTSSFNDSKAGTVTASGTKTESYSRTFNDSRSGTATISGVSAESWQQVDVYNDSPAPGIVTMSGDATEGHEATFVDAASGQVSVDGEAGESYEAPLTYHDSPAPGITEASGTGVDEYDGGTLEGSGTVELSGEGVESWDRGNDAEGFVTASGDGTEERTYEDLMDGGLAASGDTLEDHTHAPEVEGFVSVDGTGVDRHRRRRDPVGRLELVGASDTRRD
jgi:hypothetical protein